jgi:hypothetical protein
VGNRATLPLPLIVKHQAAEEAPVGFDEGCGVCCCFHGVNGKMIFIKTKIGIIGD